MKEYYSPDTLKGASAALERMREQELAEHRAAMAQIKEIIPEKSAQKWKAPGLWQECASSGMEIPGFMFCAGCDVCVPVDASDLICTPLYYCPRCGKRQF